MKDLRSSQMENLCQGTSAVTRYSVLKILVLPLLATCGKGDGDRAQGHRGKLQSSSLQSMRYYLLIASVQVFRSRNAISLFQIRKAWAGVDKLAVGLPMSRLWLDLLKAVISFYQRWVSPLSPPSCRFQPSCSTYAVEALERHGLLRGCRLSIRRLLRCHPWGGHGYDPVPPLRVPPSLPPRPIQPGTN